MALFGSPLQGFSFLGCFSQGGAALALGWYGMALQAILIIDNNALKTGMRLLGWKIYN
jgi:hypothetical protein